MDWIIKHMQNKDTTDKVMKWSNKHKLFQAKIDRQLADDFRVVSISLGSPSNSALRIMAETFAAAWLAAILTLLSVVYSERLVSK